jgi:hypothetical protein
MNWNILSALGGVVGGLVIALLTKIGQESVSGYLALRNARRHVLDMLAVETSTAPSTIQTHRQGAFSVTPFHLPASPVTREALSTYLEAAKASPLRLRRDRRAVQALARRLQFATVDIGKIPLLATCKLIAPKKGTRLVQRYAVLTAEAITNAAYRLKLERAAALGAAEQTKLLSEIEHVWRAMPARHRRTPLDQDTEGQSRLHPEGVGNLQGLR